MLNILEINDFSAPELDIYARRTEAQLINKDNPEAGLFIAESPKVIGRALADENDRIQIDKRNAVRPKASAAYGLSEYV